MVLTGKTGMESFSRISSGVGKAGEGSHGKNIGSEMMKEIEGG